MNGPQMFKFCVKGNSKGRHSDHLKISNLKRSGLDQLEERNIFNGSENPLTMSQRYTHEFQCFFRLNYYPFDRQVS